MDSTKSNPKSSSQSQAFVEMKNEDVHELIAVQSSKRRKRKWAILVAVTVTIALTVAIVVPLLLSTSNQKSSDAVKPTTKTQHPASTTTTQQSTSTTYKQTAVTTAPVSLGQWTEWTPCSVTCRNGTKTRMRNCTTQTPWHAGCKEHTVESLACSLPACPAPRVPGNWSEWSQWSSCSVTCANGTTLRMRNCSNTENGDRKCIGAAREIRNCTMGVCPDADCSKLYTAGVRQNGVYTVDPDGRGAFQVYCDMITDGGGWTVFQRRQDGSVDFYRTWNKYKTGFGNLTGEFWLGNDYTHRLTARTASMLCVNLKDWNGNKANATYETFSVANESLNYTLTAETFYGKAGDSLGEHNTMKFTTRDRDNDQEAASNCALGYKGGWWYNACYNSNLNGQFLGNTVNVKGVVWRRFTGGLFRSLKFTEMKLRPSSF